MQKNLKTKKLRKAFTLIEVIVVIVIISVLVGLFYPSIMSNKDRTNINSVIGNDAKLIVSAITEWKISSAESDGSYSNINTYEISAYLPANMRFVDPDGTLGNDDDYVTSSGLNGGIRYMVLSDKISSDGDSLKIYIDFTDAINMNHYNTRLIKYAEKTAMDKFYSFSVDKSINGETPLADGLGSANDDFSTGGSAEDGLCGTRQIVF